MGLLSIILRLGWKILWGNKNNLTKWLWKIEQTLMPFNKHDKLLRFEAHILKIHAINRLSMHTRNARKFDAKTSLAMVYVGTRWKKNSTAAFDMKHYEFMKRQQ